MGLFSTEQISMPATYDADCIFHEEHLLMDGEIYPYSEISILIYDGNSKYMNGVQLNKKINFTICFLKSGTLPYPFTEENMSGFATFSYERGLIPTDVRKGKVLEFVYDYLQKKTFNQRLNLFIRTLEKFNKFSFYEDLPEFHNNGDLYHGGKLEGNLLERFEKGKIIDGTKYGGYSNKTSDPFLFGFERGTKFFGLMADNVTFGNTINRDVLYVLLDNLFKTGYMLPK